MVKKALAKPHSERRWRSARASLRMHDDLRDAIDFLAKSDRRTVSQYLEILVLAQVRKLLVNEFDDDGVVVGDREFKLKDSPKR
jgi:hypothetical protein